MDTTKAIWSIDRISCNAWEDIGDYALVEASNYAHDSCSFELYRVPNGGTGVVNLQTSFYETDWREFIDIKEIENQLANDAEKALDDWERQIQRILKKMPKGQWRKGPALEKDLEYALTAYLKEKLSFFGGLKTNEILARRLEIPYSTAKERIRECRNRGFLTEPGKGVRGRSEMTAKARKILKEEGVINA